MENYRCPHCDAAVPGGSDVCLECLKSTAVGRLISQGSGVVRRGETWGLPPTHIRIGRDRRINDYIIDSNLSGKTHAEFIFRANGFVLTATDGGACHVNDIPVPEEGRRVRHGDVVKLGVDVFNYEYLSGRPSSSAATTTVGGRDNVAPPTATASEPPPTARVPQTARGVRFPDSRAPADTSDPMPHYLGAVSTLLTQANLASNLAQVFVNAIDAILLMTPAHRAFGYLEEATTASETELKEMAARINGHENWDSADPGLNYPICHQLLETAYTSMNPIIIADPATAGEQLANFEVGYQLMICIPLCVYDSHSGRRQVRGVLYADSIRFGGRLHHYSERLLHIIAQVVTMAILRDTSGSERLTPARMRAELLPVKLSLNSGLERIQQISDTIDDSDALDLDTKVALFHATHELATLLESVQHTVERLYQR